MSSIFKRQIQNFERLFSNKKKTMDQVITFDKSLQTRLNEFKEVFSNLDTVPFSRIKTEFAYYLELTTDPNGWQAVWKIPRIKCEEFQMPFPTVVLVYVLDVDYAEHLALTKILAVQDDIHLPKKHYVPLTQLWPTKMQDKSIGLNLHSTANSLDMLRFFYIHILMPWDEEDEFADWKGEHLLNRLHLYYDLRNGKIPKATCEHIYSLLNEARRLNNRKEQLMKDEVDSDIDVDNSDGNNIIHPLIEINVRLIEIQHKMYLLEKEVFRNVILRRLEAEEVNIEKGDEKPHIWIIFSKDTAGNYIKLLKTVEELYPNKPLSFAPNFMAKLESANTSDTILLSSGKHTIKTEGALIDSFHIKGIKERANVELVSVADGVMFDCIGNSSMFENITFNCVKTQCAILIRKGHVTLKNCKIIGDHSSTTRQGILVLNGAKLSVSSCDISGFSMAIIGNTGSSIDIRDTIIYNALCGIKVYDKCHLDIYQSTIKDCKEQGIVLETEGDYCFEGDSFDILNGVPDITIEAIKGDNNKKGNAIIKKSKIEAIENLFSNPDLDPTILEDSDDDVMETSYENDNLNNTVLKVHD